jgi:hypothetical protein
VTKPSWEQSPRLYLAVCTAIAAGCGGYLIAAYLSRGWTPSLPDAVRAAAAGLSTFFCFLAEDLQYHAMGDKYIRALLSRQPGAAMTGRPSWLVVAWLFLWGGIFVSLFEGEATAFRPFLIGYALAVSALVWYPLRRAVYERMCELCEQESAAPAPPSPPPSTSGQFQTI